MRLNNTRTRVLLAVMWQRRPTVRSVAQECGISVGNCHRHLELLAEDDLVTWQFGRACTLRATVQEEPIRA